MSGVICTDDRFEIIARYKQKLIDGTNIQDSPEEMAVIDNILFRFWQMGWLLPIPHGRLIDADAMQNEWFNLNFDRKISDGTLAYWNFQVSKIPTIIEAEGEQT